VGGPLRYRTKVDTWLILVLAGALALPLAIGLAGFVRTGLSPAAWLPLASAAVAVIIICLVAVPTRYDVTPERLIIQSGLLHWEVPLAEIVSITPTSNPLSSPAWSLKRLEVTWTRAGTSRSIAISPRHSDEFLREVADRGGMLVMADGQLRRAR
jgi:membrane protein YdbS with pleckstrin-like domain